MCLSRQKQSALNEVQSIQREIHQLSDLISSGWDLFHTTDRTERRQALQTRQARLNQEVSRYDARLTALPSRQTLEREIATLLNQLAKAKAELKSAETPPPAVIQSLPEDADLANSALFFLYKPDLLRLLSHMTMKAQQILLPWPWCCDQRQDLGMIMPQFWEIC